MTRNPFTPSRVGPFQQSRSGVAVLTAVLAVFFLGLAALGVELGYLYLNYGQLQASADAGALAGAQRLMNDGRVKATPEYDTGQANARLSAKQFAGYNRVGVDFPVVDYNPTNHPDGDIVLGYMSDPSDPNCTLDTSDESKFNAVQVRVQKTAARNGKIPAFFSRLWGNTGEEIVGKATALMPEKVTGFKITQETPNAGVLPFAIKKESWDAMLAGSGDDDFHYDGAGNIISGSDGILELSMFPIDNDAAGNSGTVDIGSPNNSTADLSRQIRFGINSSDLAYLGGALQLGSDGTLLLNGDTGISAAIKDDLESIKGKPRSICIYTTVSANGNNAMYTIVGFVGVRVMKVKLTGNPKYVTIQPATVVDSTAIIGDSPNSSKYIYSNVRLVR